jgi:hypothetical protein
MSSKQPEKTSTTMQDDDTGPALTSVPSHRNQGPTGLKPQLHRRGPFSLKDWLDAEVYNNSESTVTDGEYEDRKSRHNTASDDFPTTSDAGRTRLQSDPHSTRIGAASQSTLSPTKPPSRARSASPFGSVDKRAEPGV